MAIVERDCIGGKVCGTCHEWKPLNEFSPKIVRGLPISDGYQYRCKACHRKHAHERYTANPEKYRARAREYHTAHPAQKRAYDRARYQNNIERERARTRPRALAVARANPEQNRARAKAWYAANIEKARARNRLYQDAHAEQSRARYRSWRRKNLARASELSRIRRVRQANAEGSHTEVEWQGLKAYYNYTCLCCRKSEPEIALTRDHVIPITKGGSDDIANIQPLCKTCNCSKGTKTIDYREQARASA